MDGSDKTIEALREAVEEIMASYLQDFKMDLYVTFRNELEHQLSLRSRIEPLMSVKVRDPRRADPPEPGPRTPAPPRRP